MAYSSRKRLDLIRELINAKKLKDARRRLARFTPAQLDRYERGYYYFLLSRFDLLGAVYRVQNVNHALRLLSEFAPADGLYY